MSKLKAIESSTAVIHNVQLVYIKSEADKVISELKAQKAQAEDDCAYWKMSEGNAANAMHETEEYAMQLYRELRHHKYKRCLDKAKMLDRDATIARFIYHTDSNKDFIKSQIKKEIFYRKWSNKWLELAWKFKPEGKC